MSNSGAHGACGGNAAKATATDQGFQPAPWDDPAWHRARALLLQCLDPWHVHPQVRTMLAAMPASETRALLACAEFHGMTALLMLHADGHAPPGLRRAWAPMRARAAHAARARHDVLAALLQRCHARGVEVLLLKGAALRYTVYPEATLRPMRDLDLMPAPGQMDGMLEAMQDMGFSPVGPPPPPGHHHLRAQRVIWQHAAVHVEPHVGLGLSRGIDIAPDALFASATRCDVGGMHAWVPSIAHGLWHVYRHGFAMPFGSEAAKLIWLADLHALGERACAHPDFAAALQARPALRRVLAALHAAAPWSTRMQAMLAPAALGRFHDLSDYAGWPRAAMRGGLAKVGVACRATFWPPDFWLAMRHGARVGLLGRAGMRMRHWRDLLQARREGWLKN